MTEQPQPQPQDKPSKRKFGRDENQDLAYSPESYPAPDLETEGRWAIVGDNDGIIWTDDLESAGVTWVAQTPQVMELWRHFQVARSAGTPAGVAYQLAANRTGVGEEQSGPLTGFSIAFEDLMYPNG